MDRTPLDTTPVADLDAGTITRTVLVRAPKQETWEALTDPEAIGQWWGMPADVPGGMREGATGTLEWRDHGLMPIRVARFDVPTRFDLVWGQLGEEEPGETASLVQFTLDDDGQGRTLVTVLESGFRHLPTAERRAAMDDNVGGWIQVLDSFVAHVEARA
ncbi:SRPBCC domain-containing protein [Georgenia sp. Z1344]|uniref:SRPBCC domain-containing protein n=1 Tax=Georgenia sp. Z1344 TaxID=3416706 RepID=UPI003CED3C5E